MRKTKIIDIDDNKITVKELTAAEIRNIIEEAEELDEKSNKDNILSWLFVDIPASAFTICTGLSEKELENMSQSDLLKLKEAIVQLNPLLEALMERILKVAKAQGLIV